MNRQIWNEALHANDPVLIRVRARQMVHDKLKSQSNSNLKKRVYGKQRESLENNLWNMQRQLKNLYIEKREIFSDMDSESGQKGLEWTDNDANNYGEKLNKVNMSIEKTQVAIKKIEIRLNY